MSRRTSRILGSKDNLAAVYDRIAEVAGSRFAATSELSHSRIPRFFASLDPGSDILDAGSGKGAEARLAVDLGHRVTGLDISPKMLALFSENVPEAQPVLGSVTAIPFDSGRFDAVYSSCCLLHLDRGSTVQALSELFRVLKPGGRIFLVTSVGEGAEELDVNPALKEMGVESWYFYHWAPLALRAAIERAGFDIDAWDEETLIKGRPNVAFVSGRATRA